MMLQKHVHPRLDQLVIETLRKTLSQCFDERGEFITASRKGVKGADLEVGGGGREGFEVCYKGCVCMDH